MVELTIKTTVRVIATTNATLVEPLTAHAKGILLFHHQAHQGAYPQFFKQDFSKIFIVTSPKAKDLMTKMKPEFLNYRPRQQAVG